MKHYISICKERGTKSNEAIKVELCECLTALCKVENTMERKEDNFLLFPAYSSANDEYRRNESLLDKFSVIVVDCDNKQCDPLIIEKFKERMANYDYLIYETASSTTEKPKFRAIIPLDAELEWSKHAKAAIFHKFREFADPNASWFFAPNTSKVNTVFDHDVGREFPARLLEKDIDEMMWRENLEMTNRMLDQIRISRLHSTNPQTFNPEGWRNLPSVKKCLEGLKVGERDDSLNAACYAMDKNGYSDSIGQFIDEVVVDEDIKQKFRRKYK